MTMNITISDTVTFAIDSFSAATGYSYWLSSYVLDTLSTMFANDRPIAMISRLLTDYKDSLDNILNFVSAVCISFSLYFVVGLLVFLLTPKPRLRSNRLKRKRVLFVTAHPDDECMFFGPTIYKLIESCDVYLLCLTTGDRYGNGSVRKQELRNSCAVLGIPDSNITVMSCTNLPDHEDRKWSSKHIYKILLDHIESLVINEVYTFDIGGVSGHFNHTSVFFGFARMCLEDEVPKYCKVYLLDSVNIIRKYSAAADAHLSLLSSKKWYILTVRQSQIIRRAMWKHRSQMEWYRILYVIFSRYIYLNTYKDLDKEDVELVIQMVDINPFL